MEVIVLDGESSISDLTCPQSSTHNPNFVLPSDFGTSANTTVQEGDDVTISCSHYLLMAHRHHGAGATYPNGPPMRSSIIHKGSLSMQMITVVWPFCI
jgi:hypothetical protein